MKYKIIPTLLTSVVFSPTSIAMCFIDDIPDTQNIDMLNSQRLEGYVQSEFYSEPQFSSTFGELEHSSQNQLFSEAWPLSEESLAAVPATVDSAISGQAILSRVGRFGSSTLEVLGPVGDAIAVGAWVENMAATFSQESATRLDKTAAVFSIVPLVGDELNMLSNDIKYFAAKEKISEFESQTHYVFNNHFADFKKFHHKKEDAIRLIRQYDNHVKSSTMIYLDQLLLVADTEFRRIASGYDRQLARQMARIDLEVLKAYGHISDQSNLNHPLCADVAQDPSQLLSCVRTTGQARFDDIANRLTSAEFGELHKKVYQAKQSLVQTAMANLESHKNTILNNLVERAKHHVGVIHNNTRNNRRLLEERARMSGLREYAAANWGLEYLSEEQLNTATFLVKPARVCWGVPSVYPGGIQASIDACKDSGALYDTYHVSKDPELVEVIGEQAVFDVETYVSARVFQGWKAGLLRSKLLNVASSYAIGKVAHQTFERLIEQLATTQVLPYQTPFIDYLNSKGLDGSDIRERKDWYQISRWYELILTEKPSGGIISNIKQYEVFRAFIKPLFEQAITAAYLSDVYYSIPYPHMYSSKDLRFYSPILADEFDQAIEKSTNETLDENLVEAVNNILGRIKHLNTANELQYLLGDLAVYAQIAQHQQSEVNVQVESNGNILQLFNAGLSPVHMQYLNETHYQLLLDQVGDLAQHQIRVELNAVGRFLSMGDFNSAIDQLGSAIRTNNAITLPFINEILLHELEDLIELQIAVEG
jgi:hypothetical protein